MIVGTAGHIDHGKTALVHALTGVDTDRLKEEKTRGISIDLGFAYLPTGDRDVLGFVDVPGHEKFVRNMLAGATEIDFVLLVVAADDGVMPQTMEHLAIVDLLGISHGIVALSKVDLVPPARREQVIKEIRDRLSGTRLAHIDIAPVSAVTGEGITELREKIVVGRAKLRGAGGARPVPARRGPLFHAHGRGNDRDRHGSIRCRWDRRSGDHQSLRTAGARAIHTCAEPTDGARASRRALRAQSCRRRHYKKFGPARRRRPRSRTACADRPHRRDAASATERGEAGRPVVAGAALSRCR